MREIVLDTETTGLDPLHGHRIVEIGCVELINHLPSGKVFHHYINPERDMPPEAERVHGLSSAFLSTFPPFKEICQHFLDFIADDRLVIHNADFDMKFLNAELTAARRPALRADRALDTVKMARRRFPGARASLDTLCARFNIDNSHRTNHGALLDAELLAEVYLELIGGRQPGLALVNCEQPPTAAPPTRQFRAARPFSPSAAEEEAHRAFLKKLTNPLWDVPA